MDRRMFIGTAAGGFLAAARVAWAQRAATVPRISVLSPFVPSDAARWHEAFRQGLRER